MVQHKNGRDLVCTLLQEHQQERSEDHIRRAELGQPRHHYGSKAPVVCGGGGNGVIRAAHQQQAGNAAHGAGQSHRAQNHFLNIDTDIAGGVYTLAYHGDLITVLAVL